MKVGDLVKFKSGYYATLISHLKYSDSCYWEVYVHADVPFKNPTMMGTPMLRRTAEVISEAG
tara:strand:- start:2310 stop:2495 length:186 start_codon:yes stop_codon:yes gene_type:complete